MLPPWTCSWFRPLASTCLRLCHRPDRRDLVWINVTPHPTAEWVARQITEAFPWNEAPRYMIRDRDRIYGALVTNPSLLQASFSAPRPMFISWRRPGTLLDTAEMILVLSGYMLTFAAKLGFAFHYEVNGTPLPTGGGAQVMWFSNLHERTDPREIFSLLPAPLTLQQGRKTARRAISILVRPRRTRTHVVLCFIQSVLCCCRRDRHRPIWLKANADKFPVFAPGDFGGVGQSSATAVSFTRALIKQRRA